MTILVGKGTRVVVQGITGSAGSFHAKQCIAYGTQIVAGCTPGRGGEKFLAEGPGGKAHSPCQPREDPHARLAKRNPAGRFRVEMGVFGHGAEVEAHRIRGGAEGGPFCATRQEQSLGPGAI